MRAWIRGCEEDDDDDDEEDEDEEVDDTEVGDEEVDDEAELLVRMRGGKVKKESWLSIGEDELLWSDFGDEDVHRSFLSNTFLIIIRRTGRCFTLVREGFAWVVGGRRET